MKRIFFVLLSVCLTVICPASIYAQFETASVLGYVHDSSGAVVSGATVSLINEETKAQVTVQTSAQGSYEFTDVKIGQYQVTAQANGFDTSTTQAFTVTVNARQRVDVSLKIGSNTEFCTNVCPSAVAPDSPRSMSAVVTSPGTAVLTPCAAGTAGSMTL